MTNVLDLHLKIIPIELLLHKCCQRSAVQLALLPDTHPISPIFLIRERRQVKSHRSPLHELMYAYNVDPDSMEKMHMVCFTPCYTKKLASRVAVSTEEAIEQE